MLHLQNVNPSKLTELSWFKTGGTEEEVDILIQSLMCKLPFTYTKCTGTGRRQTCNKSAYIFFSSYSQWNPQNSFYFISSPLFSFFSSIFLPPLQSAQVCISRFLFYTTPLCCLQWKGRQTDRQQGQGHCQPKVTSSDSHALQDLILSQNHFNFIKGRESKLICIWAHSISSAHMFIALESPSLIPWPIRSQEGNTAQER